MIYSKPMHKKLGYQRKRPTPGPVREFKIRLPLKSKKALDVEAAKQGISLAAHIRQVLDNHLTKKGG